MTEQRQEIFGIDRKKALLSVVLGLVLVVAAVAGIGQITSFHKDGRAAYRDVARVDGGPVFPLWTATRVVAIGFGAYALGTSAGSLGLDYWALHRAGE